MHESKSQCKRHWHPAFFAGLQIELSEERSNLIFENEHLLGTKPTQIDVIIVKKNNPGIYYIKGDFVPIQFIVTSELEKKKNLWLYSLTDELCGEKDVVQLIQEYKKHQNQYLYESVMDIIVRANADMFKEGDNVCRALEEIMLKRMQEELEERERLGVNIGISQGIIQGEQYFVLLTQSLLSDSRINDLQKAIVDCDFRRGLYMEYGIGRDEGFCERDGSGSSDYLI